MEVFELHYPGTWLENVPDQHNVQTLLIQLEHQLADAAIGLALFKETSARPPTPAEMQRQSRTSSIAQAMVLQLPHDLSPEQRFKEITAIYDSADLEARQEEWAAGRMPDSYQHRLPFIYAHAVVYALDAIGKTLNVLTEMGLTSGVTDAYDAYETALPYLISVRDSAHHTEDRARGLDRRGRPLVLQPINNRLIHAPNGALALSNLSGNMLGYTASDGHYREIEISTTSVRAAQSAIQQVLDALTWRGPVRTIPR